MSEAHPELNTLLHDAIEKAVGQMIHKPIAHDIRRSLEDSGYRIIKILPLRERPPLIFGEPE